MAVLSRQRQPDGRFIKTNGRFIKPVNHFIARRPFNGGPWTFYEAKAARRPFYRP